MRPVRSFGITGRIGYACNFLPSSSATLCFPTVAACLKEHRSYAISNTSATGKPTHPHRGRYIYRCGISNVDKYPLPMLPARSGRESRFFRSPLSIPADAIRANCPVFQYPKPMLPQQTATTTSSFLFFDLSLYNCVFLILRLSPVIYLFVSQHFSSRCQNKKTKSKRQITPCKNALYLPEHSRSSFLNRFKPAKNCFFKLLMYFCIAAPDRYRPPTKPIGFYLQETLSNISSTIVLKRYNQHL